MTDEELKRRAEKDGAAAAMRLAAEHGTAKAHAILSCAHSVFDAIEKARLTVSDIQFVILEMQATVDSFNLTHPKSRN